jgi:hypothetical protein
MARSTLLTQKEYAKRKRCTPQYISKLVRQGKIKKVGNRIDARQADAALRDWKREGRVIGRRASSKPKSRAQKKPSSTGKLYAARADRESFQAKLAELTYKRELGELVPAADVLEAERRKNANFRASFRRLARSLAPLLHRATSPAEVERLLLREIDLVLGELAADPLGTGDRVRFDAAPEDLAGLAPPYVGEIAPTVPVIPTIVEGETVHG